jgi:gas vesicle protein
MLNYFLEKFMSDNRSSEFSKGLILGSIIGGAVGAIIALLYAPKPGVELRKDIADKSTEIYGKAVDSLSQLETNVGTTMMQTMNEGKTKAQNIIESAKRQAEDLIYNAEKVLDEAKSKASNAKEIVEEKIQDIRQAAKAGADAFRSEMQNPTN